jgi:outer membrane immunogenic protein
VEKVMNSKLVLLVFVGSSALTCGQTLAQTASGTDWSGPYIGLNGGYNWANTRPHSSTATVNQLTGVDAGAGAVTVPSTSFPSGGPNVRGSGFMGGGQVGFNVQGGPLVWGVEGDFDGVSARKSGASVYTLPATGLTTGGAVVVRRSTDPHWMSTIRGRAGLAMDRMLIYGTGGVAFADLHDRADYTYTPAVTGAVTAANPGVTYGPYVSSGGRSGVRTGWTAGGGVEFLASRNMTIGAEYRHTEIGGSSRSFGSIGANGVSETGRLGFSDDAVLARINFKFSGLGHLF